MCYSRIAEVACEGARSISSSLSAPEAAAVLVLLHKAGKQDHGHSMLHHIHYVDERDCKQLQAYEFMVSNSLHCMFLSGSSLHVLVR